MRKNISVVLMIFLYLLIFASAFCLITYFNQIILIEPALYQLIAGAVFLLIAVIIFVVNLLKNEKREDKELQKSEKMKQVSLNLDQQIIEEETEEAQKTTVNDGDNDEFSTEQEIYLSTNKLNLLQTQNEAKNDTIEFKIDDTATLNEKVLIADESESKATENDVETDELENKTDDPVIDPSLSETQILYIKNSENSYINEKGLPQLMITQTMDSAQLRGNGVQTESGSNNGKENNHYKNELDEEIELQQEEKNENLHMALDRAILVVTLMIIIVGIYFALSVFAG